MLLPPNGKGEPPAVPPGEWEPRTSLWAPGSLMYGGTRRMSTYRAPAPRRGPRLCKWRAARQTHGPEAATPSESSCLPVSVCPAPGASGSFYCTDEGTEASRAGATCPAWGWHLRAPTVAAQDSIPSTPCLPPPAPLPRPGVPASWPGLQHPLTFPGLWWGQSGPPN